MLVVGIRLTSGKQIYNQSYIGPHSGHDRDQGSKNLYKYIGFS